MIAPTIVVALARDFVRVHGPDAHRYLQSQLSQDLDALAVGGSCWSFLLQPTGKVEALVRVNRIEADEFVLDVDGGYGERVIARLNRFKIRVKADITPLDWQCVAQRGPHASATPGPHAAVVPWTTVAAIDLIGPSVEVPLRGSLDDYEMARLAARWPAMGAEITESTIPGETGILAHTVSFTKGCYPGQELVERIDSRGGNVARHLRLLRLDEPVEPGTRLTAGGRDVGWITSAHGTLGLGYVSRAIELPALLDAGGVRVSVSAD